MQKAKTVCMLISLLLPILLPAIAAGASDFTVVLLPDTQNYSEKFPETYMAQMEWIKSRKKADNIRFMIHLGDIVQTAGKENEWKVADRAQRILDGKVPYSVVPGNHDLDHEGDAVTRNTALFDKYFPPARFEKHKWYGGHKGENNANNFCFFKGAGMKFMVLSLEFAPSDETIAWAEDVLKAHPDRRVIVATHYYLRPEGRVTDRKPYGLDGVGPEGLWQRLISKHNNIFMVVCGHVLGIHHQQSANESGGVVHEILCDYQGEDNGGDGWLQTLRFAPDENRIYVRAYSPVLDRENRAPEQTYTLEYDMSK